MGGSTVKIDIDFITVVYCRRKVSAVFLSYVSILNHIGLRPNTQHAARGPTANCLTSGCRQPKIFNKNYFPELAGTHEQVRLEILVSYIKYYYYYLHNKISPSSSPTSIILHFVGINLIKTLYGLTSKILLIMQNINVMGTKF